MKFHKTIKQKLPYIYLCIPFLAVVILTGLKYPMIKDEPFFYSIITQFPRIYSSPANIEKHIGPRQPPGMRVMALPGYPGMQFILGKLVGFEPRKLRLLNVAFGWLAIAVFFKILTSFEWLKINKGTALFVSFLLLFNPYFFGASFLMYTDVPALCFALLGVYFYLRKRNLISAAFFIMAIFTRQCYVFLPAAIILQNVIYRKTKPAKTRILIYAIPLAGLLVCAAILMSKKWILWQHFPYKRYSFLSLFPLNELMIVIGVYSLPLILLDLKRFFRKSNFMACLWFLPMLFAIPLSRRNPFYTGTGIFTNAIIGFSEKISFFGIRYIFLFFWLLGAIAIAEALRNTWGKKDFAFFHLQLITCAAMLLFVNFFWEKYIIMILPAIFVLLAHNMRLSRQ